MQSYSIFKIIRKGTYGVVSLAERGGNKVAIKESKLGLLSVPNMRELDALRELTHPNIVRLLRTVYEGSTLYLIMECADMDLQDYIYSFKRRSTSIPIGRLKYIMWQVLTGLAYMHARHFAHRDLKPANILLHGASGHILLSDFGMTERVLDRGETPLREAEIVTLWYRAPELLIPLDPGETRVYTSAIDVWAAGCVLGDLFLASYDAIMALYPGESQEDQVGDRHLPPAANPLPRRRQLRKICVGPPSFFGCDLLQRLVAFEAPDRPSASEAANHPWLVPVTPTMRLESM